MNTHPSAQQLRERLVQIETFLSEANRQQALDAVGKLALLVEDPQLDAVIDAMSALAPLDAARDRRFNDVLDVVLKVARDIIDEREAHAKRVGANTALTRKQCRAVVLAHLTTLDDVESAHCVARTLDLSLSQVCDAFDQLQYEGSLETSRRLGTGIETIWFVRLNAHGRDLAEGSAPAPVPFVHQEFHHSQIANAGVVHGTVTQNLTVAPDLLPLIHAVRHVRELAGDDPPGRPASRRWHWKQSTSCNATV